MLVVVVEQECRTLTPLMLMKRSCIVIAVLAVVVVTVAVIVVAVVVEVVVVGLIFSRSTCILL